MNNSRHDNYTKAAGSGQYGTAIIEFVIVFPLLAMLFFGFVEFGRALYQQNSLTKTLSTGARFIARAPEAVSAECQPDALWGQAESSARDLVINPGRSEGGSTLQGLENSLSFSVREEISNGVQLCVIRAQAAMPFAGLFGETTVPLLKIGRIELSAAAEERYIGD